MLPFLVMEEICCAVQCAEELSPALVQTGSITESRGREANVVFFAVPLFRFSLRSDSLSSTIAQTVVCGRKWVCTLMSES